MDCVIVGGFTRPCLYDTCARHRSAWEAAKPGGQTQSACFCPGRPALDMPDGLCKKTECEGAPDPFVGVMESHQLPSPDEIQQQHTAAKVDDDYTHTKSPGSMVRGGDCRRVERFVGRPRNSQAQLLC